MHTLFQLSTEVAYSNRKESEFLSFEELGPAVDAYVQELKDSKAKTTKIYFHNEDGEFAFTEVRLENLKEELTYYEKETDSTMIEIYTVIE